MSVYKTTSKDIQSLVLKPSIALESPVYEWCIRFIEHYLENSGIFGKNFLQEFIRSECYLVCDDETFEFCEKYGLKGYYSPSKNSISFGKAAFEDKNTFMQTYFHEAIHAIQHAPPFLSKWAIFDKSIPIWITPRDYILTRLLLEQDAHAKTHIFMYYVAQIDNGSQTPENPTTISKMIRSSAITILNPASPDPDQSIARAILKNLLENMEDTARKWHNHMSEIEFFRLSQNNFHALGHSIGFDTFSEKRKLDLVMLPQEWKCLNDINALLGIGENENIPYFYTVLSERGMSKEDYRCFIRNKG